MEVDSGTLTVFVAIGARTARLSLNAFLLPIYATHARTYKYILLHSFAKFLEFVPHVLTSYKTEGFNGPELNVLGPCEPYGSVAR